MENNISLMISRNRQLVITVTSIVTIISAVLMIFSIRSGVTGNFTSIPATLAQWSGSAWWMFALLVLMLTKKRHGISNSVHLFCCTFYIICCTFSLAGIVVKIPGAKEIASWVNAFGFFIPFALSAFNLGLAIKEKPSTK